MDRQFESFLNDLAGELKKAAECPVWEIPMNHRTKDSISAYRASVGMMSAIVVRLVNQHRASAGQTEETPNATVQEPVVEDVGSAAAAAPDAALQPLASEPERLFDADADRPRRRRAHGDRDAS